MKSNATVAGANIKYMLFSPMSKAAVSQTVLQVGHGAQFSSCLMNTQDICSWLAKAAAHQRNPHQPAIAIDSPFWRSEYAKRPQGNGR